MTIKTFNTNEIELPSLIHQAALNPHLRLENLNEICDASKYYGFGGICTNLVRLGAARKRLGANQATKLIGVIGFPFGEIPNKIKIIQAEYAAEKGAEEIDFVPNFFALHENKHELFAEEISEICKIGLLTRVVIDIHNLSKEKIEMAVESSLEAGAHGIQVGNGFGKKISKDIILNLASKTKGRCSLKAVGGIKSFNEVLELISAGSTEIGTSVGKELIEEYRKESKL